jgi:hypothetical protein
MFANKRMQPIIDKIDRDIIKAELTPERFIRNTNNSHREIYIFEGNTAPALMKEVGRLRELTFRKAGGGSGKECDIDEYDVGPFAYNQLIVWSPTDEEIVGGYRYIKVKDALDDKGNYHLSTSEIVSYSEKLKTEFFPFTIELGRSFVTTQYQPSIENRKGLFSLDNLWDGLGALTILNPEMKYFFGKVTMYTDFNPLARDYILAFMHYYFPDPDNLLIIPNQLKITNNTSPLLQKIKGLPYKEGHHVLNKMVRELDENIPPLINSYMNLSPTMRTFGTAINTHFGYVEETGIMVTIADIYPSKKERHITWQPSK